MSHDDALVRRVTETRWAIVDERIHVVAEREDHV